MSTSVEPSNRRSMLSEVEYTHRHELNVLQRSNQWVSRVAMHILCEECSEALRPSG